MAGTVTTVEDWLPQPSRFVLPAGDWLDVAHVIPSALRDPWKSDRSFRFICAYADAVPAGRIRPCGRPGPYDNADDNPTPDATSATSATSVGDRWVDQLAVLMWSTTRPTIVFTRHPNAARWAVRRFLSLPIGSVTVLAGVLLTLTSASDTLPFSGSSPNGGSVAMQKFLILYRADASAAEQLADATPEQQHAGMQVWMDWFTKADDAVIDAGSPLNGTDQSVAGYSIMQADSRATLDHLLAGHPHTMVGTVEVYDCLPMPGT